MVIPKKLKMVKP